MERPQVEARPVAGGQLGAQPLDLALAGLVGQRLTRPADVAVGLDDRVGLGQAGRPEEVDRALARPAQCVEPGVDDEPGGAPGLRVEHPEALGLVPEQAHLVGQPLAVQAPALDVRAADHPRAEAAERDQAVVLHLERDLEMVARAPPRGRSSSRAWCTCGSAGRSRWRSRSPAVTRRGTAGSSRRTVRRAPCTPRPPGPRRRRAAGPRSSAARSTSRDRCPRAPGRPARPWSAACSSDRRRARRDRRPCRRRSPARTRDLAALELDRFELVEPDPVDLLGIEVERRPAADRRPVQLRRRWAPTRGPGPRASRQGSRP